MTTLSASQEVKPTLEQCRADSIAWEKINLAVDVASQKIARAHPGDDLSKYDEAAHYWKRFPLSEISRRSEKMYECSRLDGRNQKRYLFDAAYLESEENKRYVNFLVRHNLWNQFSAEDLQGKR